VVQKIDESSAVYLPSKKAMNQTIKRIRDGNKVSEPKDLTFVIPNEVKVHILN
jgi:hypothetical protein